MKQSISDNKKSRGRPKEQGPGKLVGVRFQKPALEKLDRWAKDQNDKPGRSEAIRRLVELALKAK